jgi:hypothetical protein
MPGCCAVVHNGTVTTVRSVIVFSVGGVVVMGSIGITTLHPWGHGRVPQGWCAWSATRCAPFLRRRCLSHPSREKGSGD